MRLVAVIVGFIVLCGSAAAQSMPVKTGLWDVTIHTEATASPAVIAAMKKDRLTGNPLHPSLGISEPWIAPPVTQRLHSCRDDATWKNYLANTTTAPPSCVFKHRSQDAHGMSSGLKCDVGDMLMVLETKLSWVNREKIHLTMRSVITYRGVAGESVSSVEMNGIFLSPNCGSVAPGTGVPVR